VTSEWESVRHGRSTCCAPISALPKGIVPTDCNVARPPHVAAHGSRASSPQHDASLIGRPHARLEQVTFSFHCRGTCPSSTHLLESSGQTTAGSNLASASLRFCMHLKQRRVGEPGLTAFMLMCTLRCKRMLLSAAQSTVTPVSAEPASNPECCRPSLKACHARLCDAVLTRVMVSAAPDQELDTCSAEARLRELIGHE